MVSTNGQIILRWLRIHRQKYTMQFSEIRRTMSNSSLIFPLSSLSLNFFWANSFLLGDQCLWLTKWNFELPFKWTCVLQCTIYHAFMIPVWLIKNNMTHDHHWLHVLILKFSCAFLKMINTNMCWFQRMVNEFVKCLETSYLNLYSFTPYCTIKVSNRCCMLPDLQVSCLKGTIKF